MPTFDEFKAQGNRAFADKEYKRAAKIYRDAIAQYGDNPIIYSNRSQCFIHLEDWTRAYKDAKAGLACNPSQKIKVKLLFRQGIASKKLDLDSEAMHCFQEVLNIDPMNAEAQEELDTLIAVPKTKKLKSDAFRKIPIELVDTLPEEFAEIVCPQLKSFETRKTRNPGLVENVSEELFGKPSTSNIKEIPKHSAESSKEFSQLPSMHFLRALMTVPVEKKVQSYRYTTGLDNSVLVSLFQTSGVDLEFFEFFIESSTFVIREDKSTRNTESIIDKLRLMSNFNRYSLTITICDDKLLQDLASVVKQVSPGIHEELEKILGSR
ncbi:hypothetical protein JCM33374_g5830 [Metschnikowia sp. JCM 33374]|nr:hypothetical protein JCM33374_g5830 [Metschnikowia sp. JCM 33374]